MCRQRQPLCPCNRNLIAGLPRGGGCSERHGSLKQEWPLKGEIFLSTHHPQLPGKGISVGTGLAGWGMIFWWQQLRCWEFILGPSHHGPCFISSPAKS